MDIINALIGAAATYYFVGKKDRGMKSALGAVAGVAVGRVLMKPGAAAAASKPAQPVIDRKVQRQIDDLQAQLIEAGEEADKAVATMEAAEAEGLVSIGNIYSGEAGHPRAHKFLERWQDRRQDRRAERGGGQGGGGGRWRQQGGGQGGGGGQRGRSLARGGQTDYGRPGAPPPSHPDYGRPGAPPPGHGDLGRPGYGYQGGAPQGAPTNPLFLQAQQRAAAQAARPDLGRPGRPPSGHGDLGQPGFQTQQGAENFYGQFTPPGGYGYSYGMDESDGLVSIGSLFNSDDD